MIGVDPQETVVWMLGVLTQKDLDPKSPGGVCAAFNDRLLDYETRGCQVRTWICDQHYLKSVEKRYKMADKMLLRTQNLKTWFTGNYNSGRLIWSSLRDMESSAPSSVDVVGVMNLSHRLNEAKKCILLLSKACSPLPKMPTWRIRSEVLETALRQDGGYEMILQCGLRLMAASTAVDHIIDLNLVDLAVSRNDINQDGERHTVKFTFVLHLKELNESGKKWCPLVFRCLPGYSSIFDRYDCISWMQQTVLQVCTYTTFTNLTILCEKLKEIQPSSSSSEIFQTAVKQTILPFIQNYGNFTLWTHYSDTQQEQDGNKNDLKLLKNGIQEVWTLLHTHKLDNIAGNMFDCVLNGFGLRNVLFGGSAKDPPHDRHDFMRHYALIRDTFLARLSNEMDASEIYSDQFFAENSLNK